MKKNIKKIALFLVLVMLVNILSGCLSWWLMTGEQLDISGYSGQDGLGLIFLPIIDVICLPVALIVFGIRMAIQAERDRRGDVLDSIDTFSFFSSFYGKDLSALTEKLNSLPDGKLALLLQRFDSLSETEIDSFLKAAYSFSDTEMSVIMKMFYDLSDSAMASSIETMNSMTQENFINMLNNLQYFDLRSEQ